MKTINLEVNKLYEWNMGAEFKRVKFIGISKPSLTVKCSSSIGHGWVFEWPDGKLFEAGHFAVKKFINEI